METPVVLIIFNRPDTTIKVFEAIRRAKPKQLLVIADGARAERAGEAEKCEAARAIIERTDWDCQVLTNYADRNLGCKQRIYSGLQWVFETVEEAIILEDDCLPHPSFFPFCEALLERYRNDERIFSITGQNVQWGRRRTDYSYYFSHYFQCWGWASWRRAWQKYDWHMQNWSEARSNNLLRDILQDRRAIQYWTSIFEITAQGRYNAWDYPAVFTCWMQNMLCIVPNVNLISNIGFGAAATNTAIPAEASPFANMPTEEITLPLQHPPYMVRHAEADRFTQTSLYDVNLMKRAVRKARRLLKWKR